MLTKDDYVIPSNGGHFYLIAQAVVKHLFCKFSLCYMCVYLLCICKIGLMVQVFFKGSQTVLPETAEKTPSLFICVDPQTGHWFIGGPLYTHVVYINSKSFL